MKKTILVSGTVILLSSLGAYGYMNWSTSPASTPSAFSDPTFRFAHFLSDYQLRPTEPEFIYDVNPRFMATITKEELEQATQLSDLLPENATDGMSDFSEVKVHVLKGQNELSKSGMNERLNSAQLELLRTIGYSENFFVTGRCKYNNKRSGQVEDYDLVYYVSVVPEIPAQYKYGQDGLLYYLREQSKKAITGINVNAIQPGKLIFTITTEGQLTNVHMESSCGIEKIDKVMRDALKNIPEGWEPAKNQQGDKVEQILVFSYGIMGC